MQGVENKFGVQLDLEPAKKNLQKELKQLEDYRRVTNYLSAAQLYLKENFLLRDEL
jgi:phosphoketolase